MAKGISEDFEKMMSECMEEAELRLLMLSMEHEPSVSIRLNPSKSQGVDAAGLEPVPWSTSGYYLPKKPAFTFDPLLHAGCYYVQEASSMFLEQVLRTHVQEPVVMLDMCAAPGGKSTLSRSVLPEGSLLVANEVMRNRAQVLLENITKWGSPDVVVTSSMADVMGRLTGCFDVILTDVPCSGEGMFRKDDEAIEDWSLQNVRMCQARQREILEDLWPSLKAGGILIYSTCTYNTFEDEENVDWICRELGAEMLEVPTQESWNIRGCLDGSARPLYHFMPHMTRGEGIFMAVMRKTSCEEAPLVAKGASKKTRPQGARRTAPLLNTQSRKQLMGWISAPSYELIEGQDSVFAFPSAHMGLLDALKASGVYLLQAGCEVAELKGRDLVPSHALALSTLLNPEAFQKAPLSYEDAIAYLRRESIALDGGLEKGFALVTYQGTPLGWVKNVGGRGNNLYPQMWKIKSSHVPEKFSLLP